MNALLLALSLLGPAAPSVVVAQLPVVTLDCSRGDVDAEMDECQPDETLGLSVDGFYLSGNL